MKTMPLSEAKAQLSKLVDAVDDRDEQVTITRNGRPAAVVVSPDEFESWQATIEIALDPDFMASIRRGLRDLSARRVLSERELEALFGPVGGPRKPGRVSGRGRPRRAGARGSGDR